MLGQACMRRLETMVDWTVAGTQRSAPDQPHYLDVATSTNDLEQACASHRWEFIVNAIGLLKPLIDVRNVESVRQAVRVNAIVPHEIAEISARYGARVIHVSTDAIFGASADAAYTEAHPASPADFYGMTKGLGECGADHVLNLRCSIVGRDAGHGRGLVEWLLGHRPGTSVNGFVDYVWSAATTTQVAELCTAVIERGVFDRFRAQSPVYHFAPNPPMSKFEFLQTLADVSGSGVTVAPVRYPGGAFRRTLATMFDDFQRLFPEPRSWTAVIADALGRAASSRDPFIPKDHSHP